MPRAAEVLGFDIRKIVVHRPHLCVNVRCRESALSMALLPCCWLLAHCTQPQHSGFGVVRTPANPKSKQKTFQLAARTPHTQLRTPIRK